MSVCPGSVVLAEVCLSVSMSAAHTRVVGCNRTGVSVRDRVRVRVRMRVRVRVGVWVRVWSWRCINVQP